jgi:hypothetical protein
MKFSNPRLLGMPAPLFWICGFLLGLAAYIPAIVAWFTAEELSLLHVGRDDPFAIWAGRDGQPGFFRPVIPMVIWLWQKLWGLEPRPFHILNVLLHLVNSVRQPATAAIAALWFWVGPAHSEAVAWIPAITDVAAATGALASLAAYLQYRTSGGWGWAVASVLFYCIALCTKESAITLPAAIFIYEGWRATTLRSWNLRNAYLPMAFVVAMAGYFLLRKMLMGVFLGGYGAGVHDNFSWERLQWALSPNLANAFLPLPGLTVFHKNGIRPVFALICIAAITWRRRSGAGSPMAIAAIAVSAMLVFLPGLNLGPGLITEGQRFAYLPSAFGVTALAYTATYAIASRRALTVTAWVVALAGAALLASYNNNWYVAGKVARKIVRDMKDLPQARRTYVLTTTDSYREAFIMPHSLGVIYTLMVKEPKAGELVMASKVSNWKPDLGVQVVPTQPFDTKSTRPTPAYQLSLDKAGSGHAADSKLEGYLDPYTAQWFAVEQTGENQVRVQLRDYNAATDQVYYLSGKEWVKVQGPQ